MSERRSPVPQRLIKGYIVGYLDSWGNDRTTQIIGYYTTWKKAVSASRILEAENVFKYSKSRKIFIVEIEANKNYVITNPIDWIQNYRNYEVYTLPETPYGFTVKDTNSGRICDVNF